MMGDDPTELDSSLVGPHTMPWAPDSLLFFQVTSPTWWGMNPLSWTALWLGYSVRSNGRWNRTTLCAKWLKVRWSRYRPPTKLREGNVFRGVCLSTGVYLWSHVLSRGWVSLVPGPLGRGGGYVQGVGMSEGWVCPGVGTLPTPDMAYYGILSASGWYASYWNAFLCSKSVYSNIFVTHR